MEKKPMATVQSANIRKAPSIDAKLPSEGAIGSVRMKRVEFRENVRTFFPQGQSELFAITKCPY